MTTERKGHAEGDPERVPEPRRGRSGAGGADEDPSDGFAHGGGHMPHMEDDAARSWVMEGLTSSGGLLLGRVTYEIFAAYWPNAPAEEADVANPINAMPKYVASTTLAAPSSGRTDPARRRRPRRRGRPLRKDGSDLHVIGSTRLAQTLIPARPRRRVWPMIDPLMLGGLGRIFAEDGEARRLRPGRQPGRGDRRDPGDVRAGRRLNRQTGPSPPVPTVGLLTVTFRHTGGYREITIRPVFHRPPEIRHDPGRPSDHHPPRPPPRRRGGAPGHERDLPGRTQEQAEALDGAVDGRIVLVPRVEGRFAPSAPWPT